MTTLSQLETKLRERPNDPALCLVYSDALMARGDPRGELIGVQHALATTRDPRQAAVLSARCLELVRRHWHHFVGRPGGYPFQASWQGRRYIGYQSAQVHQLARALGTGQVYAFVRTFLERFTDCYGPETAQIPQGMRARAMAEYDRDGEFPPQLLTRSRQWLSELHGVLGPGTWTSAGFWERSAPPLVPIHGDLERFLTRRDLVGNLVLDLPFRLTWADSSVLLPYQEPDYYLGETQPRSGLRIDLAARQVSIAFAFPFEDFDGPFAAYCASIEDCLGDVFSRRDLVRFTPASPHTARIQAKGPTT